jgi:glutathione S-transferase
MCHRGLQRPDQDFPSEISLLIPHTVETMIARTSSYRLLMTPRSPFARRVRLALARLGIPFEAVLTDVFKPSPEFLKTNPLGLVPVLIHPEATIPDSAAILEYLHAAHGGAIWPKDPLEAARVRAQATLAEGIMAATVSHYLERLRPSPHAPWLEEQEEIIRGTLAALAEQELGETQAAWDLAVALEYLDLRIPSFDWRKAHPRLVDFLEKHRVSPDFAATQPPPQ